MTKGEAIYILRNAAWLGTDDTREKTEQAVEMAVEALMADIVPKHGHWIPVKDWDTDERYICSACFWEFNFIDGNPEKNDYLYCPHCGAKLDE